MFELGWVLQEQEAEQTDIRSCPDAVTSFGNNSLNMKIQVM